MTQIPVTQKSGFTNYWRSKRIRIKLFRGDKNSIIGARRQNLSEQWVQYSFQGKTPIPTKELEISIGLSHTQGEMWIDDVSLFLDDKE